MKTVLGYQYMDFKGDDGNHIKGTMLYYSSDDGLPESFVGKRAARVFLPDNKWDFCLMEGEEFELDYDDQKRITYFGYPRVDAVGFRKC